VLQHRAAGGGPDTHVFDPGLEKFGIFCLPVMESFVERKQTFPGMIVSGGDGPAAQLLSHYLDWHLAMSDAASCANGILQEIPKIGEDSAHLRLVLDELVTGQTEQDDIIICISAIFCSRADSMYLYLRMALKAQDTDAPESLDN
jgi:hypothetical protein